MTSELSIVDLFLNASLLVQIIMGLLLFSSVVSWTIIVQKSRLYKSAAFSAREFEAKFWSGIDLNKLYAALAHRRDSLTGLEKVFHSGYGEFMRLRKQEGVSGDAVMDGTQRSMRVTFSREMDDLEGGLSLLATIGSVSPYVGLFGTVWGIMHSFISLGSVKQATLAMVAPGIAEALVATAMGLFAAIPAVIAYNRYSAGLEKLENQYRYFFEEFSGLLHRKAHSKNTATSIPAHTEEEMSAAQGRI
ncbi:MAG: protein TolQ [Gammaproteobacteria bacterium CG22_combo_CG10-13_8_21_14_all_40_8]|nr:MAG: protein TolQ [Gammaproteobacteria bacterium CG22_combo_CG10-13_8_21_14_all_40_8]